MGSMREDLGEGFKGGIEFVKDAFNLGVKETFVKGKGSKKTADHTSTKRAKSVGKKAKVKKTVKKNVKRKVRKNAKGR